MSALEAQVGGNHYKKYPLQPVYYAQVNGYDTCSSYALKHITRHADKLGRQDLDKAIHYVELRQEILAEFNPAHFRPFEPTIPMAKYISLNKIPKPEAYILDQLDLWLRNPAETTFPETIKRKLRELADVAYPETEGTAHV